MKGTISFTVPLGVPVPVGDTIGALAIACWLGCDLQSKGSIDRSVAQFRNASADGGWRGYQGTGNAFSVFATGEMILVECVYVEEHKVCMTISQMLATLDRYRAFLSSNYKALGVHCPPFEVEYCAEGIDAPECYLERGGILERQSDPDRLR